MSNQNNRGPKVKNKLLIHQTSLSIANIIINSQQMKPGTGGSLGAGIYFANTFDATNFKAHQNGVYLIALVDIGRSKAIDMRNPNYIAEYTQAPLQGYDSIFGYGFKSGKEYVIFNSSSVKYIMYAYGTPKPTAVFKVNLDKLPVFFFTTKAEAAKIVKEQKYPHNYNGVLGRGVYLYESAQDAENDLPNKETHLVGFLKMKNVHKLQRGERINDRLVDRGCRVFIGEINGTVRFITITNKRVSEIHYCGGAHFDEELNALQ